MSDRLQDGTCVRTIRPEKDAGDWTKAALASRRWDVLGTILMHHDSHGLTYDVQHADGTVGYYEPHELMVVPDDAHQKEVVEDLITSMRKGMWARRELIEIAAKKTHSEGCAELRPLLAQKFSDPSGNSCTCGLRRAKEESAREDWETVNGDTDRLKVPGGWLYRTRAYQATTHRENFPNEYKVTAESSTFVPDRG